MDRDQNQEQRILITQAGSGMILSRPVVLPNGITLCGPGTELSDSLIQRLTLRGIKRIHVRGHPLPARSHTPMQQRLRELHRRFNRVHHIPLMAMLERAIENEMKRQL